MAIIKLRMANDAGEEQGAIFINTDQIVTIHARQNTTEIQMTDGRPRWVKETPEEVASLAKS
jgi:uncharacterized protein YlzI (FlbEa/FlbD family)